MDATAVTLPEELLLLALDPESGRPLVSWRHISYGLAGLLLVELEGAGLATEDRGRVSPTGARHRTGEPMIDSADELFGDGGPVRERSWIRGGSDRTRDAVVERLVARGALRDASRRRFKVFAVRRYPWAGSGLGAAVRDGFQVSALGGFPDARGRAVAGMAEAIGLRRHVRPASGSAREFRTAMRAALREVGAARTVSRMISAERSNAG